MKVCSKCNTAKEEVEFSLRDKNTGRRHSVCKLCHSKYRKAHYFDNEDKYRVKARSWASKKGVSFSGKTSASKTEFGRSIRPAPATKSEELGMSFSTASSQLKKLILFQMVQELGRDICFRCGQKIADVNELSIDHKIPWLHIAVELFWDLSNIAFSHVVCNSKATRKSLLSTGFIRRKIGAEGTAWCIKHQDFLAISNFSNNLRNWNKLESYCKDCRKQMRKL